MAEYVTTHGLMLAPVAAGYGIGFSSAAHLADCQHADVVARPLADRVASLTTYLLRLEGEMQGRIEAVHRSCSACGVTVRHLIDGRVCDDRLSRRRDSFRSTSDPELHHSQAAARPLANSQICNLPLMRDSPSRCREKSVR